MIYIKMVFMLLFVFLAINQATLAGELLASTFLGGISADGIGVELPVDMTVDVDGNIILVANTNSTDFQALPGCHTWGPGGGDDLIVVKLNPELSEVLALAIIGGSGDETGVALAIGNNGKVYIITNTNSLDYPTTVEAYSRVRSGDADFGISVLNSSLTDLEASSFFGGSGYENQPDIAVDDNDHIFVCGLVATSSGFPATTGAFSESFSGSTDFFVSKLSNDLSTLLASTYLGGQYAEEFPTIVTTTSGEIVISGRSESEDYPTTSGAYDESYSGPPSPGQVLHDVVVSKLSADLSSLLASTFAGGSMYDGALYTAVDLEGNIIVTGHTASTDYPVTAGCYDAVHNGVDEMFISKFNSDLSDLISSTFLTPSNLDINDATFATGLTTDNIGNILYTGVTWGTEMPTTENAFDNEFNGGMTDGMVFLFSPDLSSLVYASYLGGSQTEWYVVGGTTADDNIVLAGNTASADFPTTMGAYENIYSGGSTDLFISKLEYTCCIGIRGDFNGIDGDIPDIADIVFMVEYQFLNSGIAPSCENEADIDGIEGIDIGDLVYMVEYQFLNGPVPPDCP